MVISTQRKIEKGVEFWCYTMLFSRKILTPSVVERSIAIVSWQMTTMGNIHDNDSCREGVAIIIPICPNTCNLGVQEVMRKI